MIFTIFFAFISNLVIFLHTRSDDGQQQLHKQSDDFPSNRHRFGRVTSLQSHQNGQGRQMFYTVYFLILSGYVILVNMFYSRKQQISLQRQHATPSSRHRFGKVTSTQRHHNSQGKGMLNTIFRFLMSSFVTLVNTFYTNQQQTQRHDQHVPPSSRHRFGRVTSTRSCHSRMHVLLSVVLWFCCSMTMGAQPLNERAVSLEQQANPNVSTFLATSRTMTSQQHNKNMAAAVDPSATDSEVKEWTEVSEVMPSAEEPKPTPQEEPATDNMPISQRLAKVTIQKTKVQGYKAGTPSVGSASDASKEGKGNKVKGGKPKGSASDASDPTRGKGKSNDPEGSASDAWGWGSGKGKSGGVPKGSASDASGTTKGSQSMEWLDVDKEQDHVRAKKVLEKNLRECQMCNKSQHWRDMEGRSKLYVDGRPITEEEMLLMGTMEEPVTEKRWTHICFECVARRDNMTLAETIKTYRRAATEKQARRAAAFKTAMKNPKTALQLVEDDVKDEETIRQALDYHATLTLGHNVETDGLYVPPLKLMEEAGELPSAGTASVGQGGVGSSTDAVSVGSGGQAKEGSNKLTGKQKKEERRNLRRAINMRIDDVAVFFAPIIEIIALKWGDAMHMAEANDRLELWLSKRHSKQTAEPCIEESGLLMDDLHAKAGKYRAFEGDYEMMKAADYTDEWFRTSHSSFRFFYVCMGGTGYGTKCGSVISSGRWVRRFDNPTATAQRWYCGWCGSQYKTTFGVLIEFVQGSGAPPAGTASVGSGGPGSSSGTASVGTGALHYFVRAEFPPPEWQDAKWLSVQKHHGGARSAAELMMMLPEVQPLAGNLIQPRPPYQG